MTRRQSLKSSRYEGLILKKVAVLNETEVSPTASAMRQTMTPTGSDHDSILANIQCPYNKRIVESSAVSSVVKHLVFRIFLGISAGIQYTCL
jgi:hypothetical protein